MTTLMLKHTAYILYNSMSFSIVGDKIKDSHFLQIDESRCIKRK